MRMHPFGRRPNRHSGLFRSSEGMAMPESLTGQTLQPHLRRSKNYRPGNRGDNK